MEVIVILVVVVFFLYQTGKFFSNKQIGKLDVKYSKLIDNFRTPFRSQVLLNRSNKYSFKVIHEEVEVIYTLSETTDGMLRVTYDVKLTNTAYAYNHKFTDLYYQTRCIEEPWIVSSQIVLRISKCIDGLRNLKKKYHP